MYKILIVDDELIERKGLNKILTKQFGSTITMKEASTGMQAIEVAKEYQPHLIFMDIKMPGMNGIETMKEIKKFLLDVNVVIISAFDSFNYAQAALNNHAYEYLLKPVKRKQIIKCIKRLMKEEEKKKDLENEKSFLEKVHIKTKAIIEQNIIDYIISNKLNRLKEIISEGLTDFDFDFGTCVIIDRPERTEVANQIIEFLNINQEKYLYRRLPNVIVVFTPLNKKVTKSSFQELYKEIKDKNNAYIKMVFTEYETIDNIYEAYTKNIHNFYIDSLKNNKNLYPIELEGTLLNKIKYNLLDECLEILDQIYTWIDQYMNSYQLKKRYLLELEVFINRELYKKKKEDYILKSCEVFLMNSDNIEAFKRQLKLKLSEELKDIILQNNSNLEELIQDAKKYIQNHYMEDLTLESVANEMCMSSYYFSKVFKREADINFIDYLTEVRIDNAKYKIRNTNKSIKQISKEVGYNDANYFSRVFKKNTGYSPSKYKKK